MFEKQATENNKKKQQTQIQEIKTKTTNLNTPALAKQETLTNTTTKKTITNKQESTMDENPCKSAVQITPSLTVKVLGKNVNDLMSLKSFLARKKSERDSKQAKNCRTPQQSSDSSTCSAARTHTVGKLSDKSADCQKGGD